MYHGLWQKRQWHHLNHYTLPNNYHSIPEKKKIREKVEHNYVHDVIYIYIYIYTYTSICEHGIQRSGGRDVSIRAPPPFIIMLTKFMEIPSMFKQQSFSHTLSPFNLAPAERAEQGKDCPLCSQLKKEIQRDQEAGPKYWSLLAQP